MGQHWIRARKVLLLIAGAVCSACSYLAVSTTPVGVNPMPSNDACVPTSAWVVPAGRLVLDRRELLRRAAARDVVLLGELHDNAMHHAWQLDVLSGLSALRQPLVIGLEMLPRSAQPVLDAWVRGELDEQAFFARSQWRQFWRFDTELYLPILRFARLNQIPIYALNVDKTLVAAVRERGWASLSGAERGGIGDPAQPNESYLTMLFESFGMHGSGHGDPSVAAVRGDPAFQRFVESQLLWDRAMAERLADAARDHPGALVVGLMGSGHMMDGNGVPYQLAALGAPSVMTLVPWEQEFGCENLSAELADVVYGVPGLPAPTTTDRPRLGVRIEAAPGGVRVVEVVPNSVAAATEIQVGDVLKGAAGVALAKPDDLIELVQQLLPGTWMPLQIQRGADTIERVAKFPVVPP